MNDILPAPVAWLRVAPTYADPEAIWPPDGCAIYGYQDDFDGFVTLLVRHDDLPVVAEGGVIPLVRWDCDSGWQVISTMEDM